MVWLFSVAGVEPIYGHLAPFYGLYLPAFVNASTPLAFLAILGAAWAWSARRTRLAALSLAAGFTACALELFLRRGDAAHPLWPELRWQLLCAAVVLAGFAAFNALLRKLSADGALERRATARILMGLVVWAFVFPAAIAMLRDGPNGIAMAYSRTALEYIGDIGRTPDIRTLFARYTDIHPYLSMHAKVHPPGPIVLLWLLSYVTISQDALPLSIATILVGALGVLPMYAWARELTGNARTALVCATLYTLMPTIVLFTATSADILFMPFTLSTLWLFTRALNRDSLPAAVAAGLLYGLLGLMSFSLLSLGAYFACMGLLRAREKGDRAIVARVAAVMVVCALAVHLGLYWWSGYDTLEVFKLSRHQFDTDQMHLDELDPRYPSWAFRFFNPMAWFWFAGIPVSVLALWRVLRPGTQRGLWWSFTVTGFAFTMLYLGRGEGERSAMYVMPFAALPAGHLLAQWLEETGDARLARATVAWMVLQVWATECWLYTYW